MIRSKQGLLQGVSNGRCFLRALPAAQRRRKDMVIVLGDEPGPTGIDGHGRRSAGSPRRRDRWSEDHMSSFTTRLLPLKVVM
jgi:hypothetical protein